MKEEDYSKEQLIKELATARRRIVELEALKHRLKQVEDELQQERDLVGNLLDTTDSLITNFVGAVLDIANTLVVVLDRQGRILNCNPTFANTTLYSLADIKNQYLWEVFDISENLDQLQAVFRKIKAKSTGNARECVWKRKDGKYRYISWSHINIQNPDGSVAYILGTGVDITEQKLAEAEIIKSLQKEKELNELKSSFISIASHEFRNPLTAILMSAEILENFSNQLSEKRKSEEFNRIKNTIKSLTNLMDNILVISRAESRFQQFNPGWLDLEKLCNEIVEEIQKRTKSKHKIVFSSKGIFNLCYLDETLLRHILSNLLSNAIKYSPEEGTVYFDLEGHEEEAIFKITDSGIGIPVEDQKLLFTSFHRARNVRKIQGTGLGLSIVKKMVELHGGQISFESQVGVGTSFTVSLPLTINNYELPINNDGV